MTVQMKKKLIKTIFACLFIFVFLATFISADDDNSRWHDSNESHRRWDGPPLPPRDDKPRWYGHGHGYRGTGTPGPQESCPCVKRKDTGECVTYDPRFQASSVEEAILNFPDLQIDAAHKAKAVGAANGSVAGTIPPPIDRGFGPEATSDNLTIAVGAPAKSRVGAQPNLPGQAGVPGEPLPASLPVTPLPSTGLCGANRECQSCSAALVNRLSGTGLLAGTELDQVRGKFDIQQTAPRRECEKYRFDKPASQSYIKGVSNKMQASPMGTQNPNDAAVDNLMKQLQEKGEENWRRNHNSTSTRSKRQSTSKPGSTIGQQFKIDCSKRGEPVEQGSTWVGLCNVCWAWRKLPSSYFPQYVNELICDADTKCMSGWGSCQQRYKSVDILQNTGTDANPKWKQVTISVANYCDCEVESGSGMHNFVAA